MIPILILALVAAAPPAVDPALERGAHVAQRDCAACHAVAQEDKSPNPNAPTFRALRLRFNPIALERRLHPMPDKGHDAMPPRTLTVDDVKDVTDYIQSLEPPR